MAGGFGKSYFYARLAEGIREVIARESVLEENPREMVFKVNIEESVARLKFCPCCGSELAPTGGSPSGRACECGEFTITDVWSDGEVVFAFSMFAEQPPAVAEAEEQIGEADGLP